MTPGEVYLHKEFRFDDGETGKKYFIVLNNPDLNKGEPFLIIKTTSKLKSKQMIEGCIAAWRIFFIPQGKTQIFSLPTVLQLDDIYEIDAVSVISNGMKGTLNLIGKFQDELFNRVKNCLKQIKEDISEKHYNLIFKK